MPNIDFDRGLLHYDMCKMTISEPVSYDRGIVGFRHRILCSNRDEFLSRPTEFAHFHSFEVQNHEMTITYMSANKATEQRPRTFPRPEWFRLVGDRCSGRRHLAGSLKDGETSFAVRS